jgi:2-hydroxychromene-2-carboxylate isomerase
VDRRPCQRPVRGGTCLREPAHRLPLDDFERRLEDPGSLEAVRANTEELVRRGGFGSPTVFVGENMYFGHERIPLVESALMHGAEQPFIAPGEHGR